MTWNVGIMLAVVLSTGLFTAVESVIVGVDALGEFYSPRAVPVLPAHAPAVPGSAHFHPLVVAALEAAPFVEVAVAETFAYAALNGAPVVIRGAELSTLLALHDASVVAGDHPPPDVRGLLVGERAAARLGLAVDAQVRLPGTLHSDIVELSVSGIVRARGALGDELLVDPVTGARLAGLERGAAHVIEVVPRDARALESWLASSREDPALAMDLPRVARAGTVLEVIVREKGGAPVVDAEVSIDNAPQGVTDGRGAVRVTVPLGVHTWRARAPEREPAVQTLEGVDGSPSVRVARLRIAPEVPFPGDLVRVEADVTNLGDAPADRALAVTLDGGAVASLDITLAGRSSRTVAHTLRVEGAGLHDIGFGDAVIRFESVPASELAGQWRALPGGGARAATPGAAAEALFGSLVLASGFIAILAFALFFLGNAALYARLVREFEPDLSLLRALGASPAQIRFHAMRRIGSQACAAALGGLALGVTGAGLVVGSSDFTVLGHSLQIRFGASELAIVGALSVASTVGAAMVAVEVWSVEVARYRDVPAVKAIELVEVLS